MAEIVVAPLGDYPNQTTEFGPVNINTNVAEIGFKLARCTSASPTVWPSESQTIEIALDLSRDNGATFAPLTRFTAAGGIARDKAGNEAAFSQVLEPVGTGPQRRLRGTITVNGGPIRTAFTAIAN